MMGGGVWKYIGRYAEAMTVATKNTGELMLGGGWARVQEFLVGFRLLYTGGSWARKFSSAGLDSPIVRIIKSFALRPFK